MQGLMEPSVCLTKDKSSEMAAEFNTASILKRKRKGYYNEYNCVKSLFHSSVQTK